MTEKVRIPQIRFKGFTAPWEQCKLNEIADIIGGGTPSTQTSEFWDGDIDWYAPAEMEGKIYANGSERKITKLGLQKSSAKLLPAYKTILFTSRAGIGKMAILQRVGATNQGFQSLVLKDEYNPYFIYSMGSKIKTKAETIASGSTFLEVSGRMLGNIEISCPKENEQIKIGKYFNKLDNLITLHQRKHDKLVNVKKSLLEKMFPSDGEKVPKIRFKGFTDPWEQCKVGEVSSLRGRIGFRGYTREDLVNSHEGAITFSPSDIDDEGHLSLSNNDYISFEKYEESPEIKVKVGDILFTKTASIGKVAFVKELQEKATINPQFALISPNRKINNYFQFLSMRLKPFMKKVWDITGGSSIPTMSQEKLKELSFHVPLLEEQKNISDLFSNLDNLITLHQSKLEKLKNIKKSLLEKMFV